MTLPLTRRRLLHLAGASCPAIAMIGAVKAEGGTTIGAVQAEALLANRTPIRIGSVALRVRDLEKMTAFYRDVLGLAVLERTGSQVRLGAGGFPLLALEHKPSATLEPPTSAGLYHTAFLMPSRKDLARWLVHVAVNRVPLAGFADHLVSEAVYLDDPEGNGIEVYSDRDPNQWKWSDGAVIMGTEQLDVDGILSLTNIRVNDYAQAPEGLRIGHMHLRVGGLESAAAFYRDAVGFAPTRQRNGATFLSSGGYHHHVGMNTWRSAGAGMRDETATGLAWFSLHVADSAILEQQEQRLRKAGAAVATITGGIETADPWGTRLRLLRTD
ncbi:VOC family protein [Microvirga makkahensis]|uniref:VOC family protein n=1 Tax=Microvirga makkahensis TaxID=1128670 RepID=A0A7X3MWM4_9HYPH|nr:VOC family protein [Microvirga makkahensis]MXQ14370.1 VOC family protein [Microvirga makkahensis]